jgi:hypothetical protein
MELEPVAPTAKAPAERSTGDVDVDIFEPVTDEQYQQATT